MGKAKYFRNFTPSNGDGKVMKITSARFAFSSGKLTQIPRDGLREFAFIGRSNVGKSSLINALTGQKGLAKVSGTPGKTRLVNHFVVNGGKGGEGGGAKTGAQTGAQTGAKTGAWYLVDLPGYGYARASKSVRAEFDKLITDYVTKAEKLWFLFVLIDVRHEPQRIDLDFLTMLGEHGIPFGIVFTKSDKLGTNALAANVANYKQTLLKQWEELPPIFITSAEKRQGTDAILDYIEDALNN
jgi:GTP-binding protein